MSQAVELVVGWPTLMSSETATRYLSIDEETLFQLARRHKTPVVELGDEGIRWRRQDLDMLIKQLPLTMSLSFDARPARPIQLDRAQVEVIANAIARRLEVTTPSTERKLISIKEAGAILGIGRSSIYRMITDGTLGTRRIGRRTLVQMEDIQAILRGESVRDT